MGGVRYPTVENAYQAAKTVNVGDRIKISVMSPRDAKHYGRKVKLWRDWEDLKLEIMKGLIKQKFTIPVLRKKLLATGRRELIEGNYWGDTFWGVCNGRGYNYLGRLLMEVRKEIKDIEKLKA